MGGKGIRYLVYAITMCVIYAVISYLSSRDNLSRDPGQSDTNYIVRVPAALKYVYGTMFVFGIFLFFVFLFFKLKGGSSLTDGHLWFALVFAGIGLFVMVIATKWHVSVNGDRMSIYRLFHRTLEVSFSDIEKVEIGKKEELVLYQDGRKVVTIDGLSDNYDRFRNTLKQYGKISN